MVLTALRIQIQRYTYMFLNSWEILSIHHYRSLKYRYFVRTPLFCTPTGREEEEEEEEAIKLIK